MNGLLSRGSASGLRSSKGSKAAGLIREALAMIAAAPIVAATVVAMVAGMSAAIVLTNGRAIASERAIISTIDNAGTRSITLTARSGATFDSGLVDRLLTLTDIEWVGATRFIADATNAQVAGGAAVPVRRMWASSWGDTGLPEPGERSDGDVYASKTALAQLGLSDGYGRVHGRDGLAWFVSGEVRLQSHLRSFDSGVLVLDATRSLEEKFDQLIILTRTTAHIDAIVDTVTTLVDLDDPSKYTIATSKELAAVRSVVSGQLNAFGRSLAVGIIAITATLTCAVLVLSVMQRRKDFGRRRALGASRTLIVGLLVTQTVLLSVVGTAIGIGVATAALVGTEAPIPPLDYLGSVAVLATLVSLAGAILPSTLASRRDPMRELRIP